RAAKLEKQKKREEKLQVKKIEKKKEVSTEQKLQKLHTDIKHALKVDSPDIKKCVEALEDLRTLQVTTQLLQKHSDLVATLKKIRRYKASQEVMAKASEIYTHLKSMFVGGDYSANSTLKRLHSTEEKEHKTKEEEEEAAQNNVKEKQTTGVWLPTILNTSLVHFACPYLCQLGSVGSTPTTGSEQQQNYICIAPFTSE
uniref:Lens epithelium-derived growth factor integrase-binding domain-containing protein n=1 Tax=Callorhinchus milii TaxID=7868 RepID=A0A4W3GDP0_CALMI